MDNPFNTRDTVMFNVPEDGVSGTGIIVGWTVSKETGNARPVVQVLIVQRTVPDRDLATDESAYLRYALHNRVAIESRYLCTSDHLSGKADVR